MHQSLRASPLLVLALVGGGLFAADETKPAKPATPMCDACPTVSCESTDISQTDLAKAIADKKVTLIDCNGSDSFKRGHLPGAIDFEATTDLAKALPSDKTALIVAYCGGPKCSAYKSGIKAAAKLGYTNIKHFSGGISGWKKDGAALEN